MVKEGRNDRRWDIGVVREIPKCEIVRWVEYAIKEGGEIKKRVNEDAV